MSTPCLISLYPEALSATWADIEAAPLDVFFALGIVNPRGPTLTFVAAVGQSKIGAELPLVRVMLNPFSQRVDQIGRFQVGDFWEPVTDFAPLLKMEYWDCPTLVLVNASVPPQSRQSLTAAILARFGESVARNFRRVQRHFGDPWGRVSAVLDGEEVDISETTVDDAASGLAQLVLSPSHVRSRPCKSPGARMNARFAG